MGKKTVLGVVFSRLIGLLFFLILLAIVNILNFSNKVFLEIVYFLNNNLMIIIMFSIFFFFGELFSIFIFPFNLVCPIFNSIGSIFLLTFLFNILEAIGLSFGFLEPLIKTIVFLIVLIVGYIIIFKNLLIPKKKVKKKHKKSDLEWQDIEQEFKEGVNDLVKKFRKKVRK